MSRRELIEREVGDILSERMKNGLLVSGYIREEQFWLLINMSSIHSENIIAALKDYLVQGKSRKEVCELYKVNSGYLSTCLNRLQYISTTVASLARYYI